MSLYDRVCAYVRVTRGLPFNVRDKGDSLFMRILGTLLFFTQGFMTHFYTTIGTTIYVPEGQLEGDPDDVARAIAHEGKHLSQARRDGRLAFSLKYLFPQCLALFALLAFFAFLWTPALFALGFLVFAGPWPAPWRVAYEREAYFVSAVADVVSKGYDVRQDWYVDYMVNNYCGWGYYKMDWFAGARREIVKADMVLAYKVAKGEAFDEYASPLVKVLQA
jgi:hypothetical protein